MAWIAYKDTGYYISDSGYVKNKKGKVLANINRNKGGYSCVNLHGKLKFIHQLVAETFIPNPLKYEIVNHKDGDKHNNKVSNLEWCDRSYNQKHAYANRLQSAKKGFNHVLSKQVLMIDESGYIKNVFGSIQEAATFVKLKSYSNISKCCTGKRKRARGYFWKFCKIPYESAKQLIGRHIDWEDEPVEI